MFGQETDKKCFLDKTQKQSHILSEIHLDTIDLKAKLDEQVENIYEKCVQIYRNIHRNPQIGLEQFQTAAYIRSILADIQGITVDPELKEIPTAIIVRINAISNIQKTILFRCQLDALNWKEQSGLPHCSVNNLHHACGHDGHMAMMISAIHIVANYRVALKRNIVFCFQPGQEGKGGAAKLFKIKPDLLDNIDQCFALHLANNAFVGSISIDTGAITALSCRFKVQINGVSAHTMIPYVGVDANFIGCLVVTQMYNLVSMNVPAMQGATLVVTQISGGRPAKVSDKFNFEGTYRVTSMDSHSRLKDKIYKTATHTAESYGGSASVQFIQGVYRPVVNDQKVVQWSKSTISKWGESIKIKSAGKSFAGQDFCEFSQRRPSCYMSIGAAGEGQIDPVTKQSKFPLHSPFHRFDQKCLKVGLKVWLALAFF